MVDIGSGTQRVDAPATSQLKTGVSERRGLHSLKPFRCSDEQAGGNRVRLRELKRIAERDRFIETEKRFAGVVFDVEWTQRASLESRAKHGSDS